MRESGFTLVEVIMAMAIIATVTAGLTMSIVSSVQHTSSAGKRSQAVRVLDYIGRHVSGGTGAVLADVGTPIEFGYGDLSGTFDDLAGASGVAAPERYRATITNARTMNISGATGVQYDIQICYATEDTEACVRGTTVGPEPAAGGNPPPLEGVN